MIPSLLLLKAVSDEMSSEQSHELTKPKSVVSPLTVHRQSFQTGAFEFVPIPFVDDWLICRERRSLVTKILRRRGLRYENKVPQLLADGGARTFFSYLGGLVRALILKPLRKIFRTFLIWFTIRRAVLTVVETYFLARFVHALEAEPAHPITNSQAKAWGKVFKETIAHLEKRIAKEGTRQIWQWMKDKRRSADNLSSEEVAARLEKEAPGILADFDRRLHEALRGQEVRG